jgi:hypothetical protein
MVEEEDEDEQEKDVRGASQFLKQGRGSAGTRSPGTANAKGRGTRETSRDKAAEDSRFPRTKIEMLPC